MKVFVSWSGGKDSSLACYKAMKEGFEVSHLLNFLDEDGKRERAHGTRPFLLRLQSEAMGIPIVQVNASWEGYEEKFKQAVEELKKEGVEGGVFGDIDLIEHREWVERVCSDLRIEPIIPLWGLDPEDVLLEFIEEGFEAIVVATRIKEEWLGRRFDESFIEELKKYNFHLSGESGEYHTFVIDGPIFKRRIKVREAERVHVGENWFLDIKRGELE
ncbi:MAG: diphthine--ammonia ligase [Halobacteriota archaeon]